MAANTRGRTPVRAATPSVELLESRDVASAVAPEAPGYVVEYQEGYEYGDGTAIGWATGGYATEPAPAADAAVSLDDHAGAGEGEPVFLAPPVGESAASRDTNVYVNGPPVGTVRGTPAIAAGGVEADDEAAEVVATDSVPENTNASHGLPDEENFDLTLTVWVG